MRSVKRSLMKSLILLFFMTLFLRPSAGLAEMTFQEKRDILEQKPFYIEEVVDSKTGLFDYYLNVQVPVACALGFRFSNSTSSSLQKVWLQISLPDNCQKQDGKSVQIRKKIESGQFTKPMSFAFIHGDIQKFESRELAVVQLSTEAENCIDCQKKSVNLRKNSLGELVSVSEQISQQIKGNIVSEAMSGSIKVKSLVKAVGKPLLQQQVRDFIVQVSADKDESINKEGKSNKADQGTEFILSQEKQERALESYSTHYRLGSALGVGWRSSQGFEDQTNIAWRIDVAKGISSSATNSLSAEVKSKLDRMSQLQLKASVLSGGTKSAMIHFQQQF